MTPAAYNDINPFANLIEGGETSYALEHPGGVAERIIRERACPTSVLGCMEPLNEIIALCD